MRLALALMLCSCVRSHAVECGDFVCPESSVCVTYTPQGKQFCMDATDTRCSGTPDGTLCDDQHGTCFGGGCFPVGCGNGAIDDPTYARAEQCDDGNRQSHDGCSSACTIETPAWDQLAPTPMIPLSGAAASYLARRDEVVLFGGQHSDGEAGGETWVRVADGGWEARRGGAFEPRARSATAMAYDGRRGQVVMFGGSANGAQLRDTWVWDGGQWSPRTPAHAPSIRSGVAMAYDPSRDGVVMFGGGDIKGDPFGDTWMWSGDDWEQVMGAGGPPAGMVDHAIAYDPARGEIIMVGETGGHVETWRYAGAWSQAPGPQPPMAKSVALAWDPVDSVLVLSGPGPQQWTWNGTAWSGATTSPLPEGEITAASAMLRTGAVATGGRPLGTGAAKAVSSTWRFAHGAWTRDAVTAVPSAMHGMGVAYDSDRAKVVMFGGIDPQQQQRTDTWELGVGGWELRSTGMRPPGSPSTSLIYDPAHHVLVRIASDDQQTWTWDGAAWHQAGDLPAPVVLGALAIDPSGGVVLFGGFIGNIGQVLDTMYTFDGSVWHARTLSPAPPARALPAMAFDPVAKKVILFGGTNADGAFGDTWSYDGTAWKQLEPTGTPTPRSAAALQWNPARQRLVLFGGVGVDSWEWDRALETWVPLAIVGTMPTDVTGATTAPDGSGALVPISTGGNATATMAFARLRWSGPGPLEACSGTDADGDGLAGCDDPDCAAACKLAQCGDGACGTGESCVLCPQDCGACAVLCGDFVCDASESAQSCPGDCP